MATSFWCKRRLVQAHHLSATFNGSNQRREWMQSLQWIGNQIKFKIVLFWTQLAATTSTAFAGLPLRRLSQPNRRVTWIFDSLVSRRIIISSFYLSLLHSRAAEEEVWAFIRLHWINPFDRPIAYYVPCRQSRENATRKTRMNFNWLKFGEISIPNNSFQCTVYFHYCLLLASYEQTTSGIERNCYLIIVLVVFVFWLLILMMID